MTTGRHAFAGGTSGTIQEAMPRSKAAAEQALATDGNLAQAHMSLAYASFTYDWDWPDATRHVDHAIALDREAVPVFSENPVVILIG